MSTTPNQPGGAPSATVNYCQNCGRPLSADQVRGVGNMIFCEPCLAQRAGVPGVPPPLDPYGIPLPVAPPVRNSPVLAGLLGFIPGVGAMYNGQVAKGLVHVLIFIALVSVTDRFGPFGILVAFWVFYQAFDAYQTAQALQRGLPVPDPLGLNNIGARFGIPQQQHTYQGYAPPPAANYPATDAGAVPASATEAEAASQPYAAQSYVSQSAQPFYAPPPAYGEVPPPVPPYMPPPMPPEPPVPSQHSVPTGAIVLIFLGVLFLLHTAGYLSMHWMHHGWPLLLIGLGVWIVIRNTNRNRGGSL